MKKILSLLFLMLSHQVTVCFSPDTLIKTPYGYTPIGSLKRGDLVTSHDGQHDCSIPIIARAVTRIDTYLQLCCDLCTVCVAKEHRLYLPVKQQWVKAVDISIGDVIAGNGDAWITVDAVNEIYEPLAMVDLALAQHHVFFISDQRIMAHNFFFAIPLLTFTFGQGVAIASATAIAAGIGTGLARSGIKRMAQGAGATVYSGGGFSPHNPNDSDEDGNHASPKKTSETAESLGFEKTNYRSHGQPVYKRGNRYITRDVDSHNGGFWKMADSVDKLASKRTRMGTYDQFLNRIGD